MKNSSFILKTQNSINSSLINNSSTKETNIKSGISINKITSKEYPSNFRNDM